MVLAVHLGACRPQPSHEPPRGAPCVQTEALSDRQAWRDAVAEMRRGSGGPLLAVELAASLDSTCALDRAGEVWCWGAGFTDDGLFKELYPIPLSGPARALDGGDDDDGAGYCALLSSGTIECWSGREVSERIVLEQPATALVMGGRTLIIRKQDGSHTCWSLGRGPCAGDGSTTWRDPGLVDDEVACISPDKALRVAGGACFQSRTFRLGLTPQRCDAWAWTGLCGTHSAIAQRERPVGCELRPDGEVRCSDVHRGLKRRMDTLKPPPEDAFVVMPIGEAATQIVSDHMGRHTCALGRSGRAYCWGYNEAGQVGVAPIAKPGRPVHAAGLHDIVEIAGEYAYFCALDSAGGLWCWGDADCRSSIRSSANPVLLGRFDAPHSLAVADGSVCVVTAGGIVRCMGFTPDPGTTGPDAAPARAIWRRTPARAVSLSTSRCTLHGDDVICRSVEQTDSTYRLDRATSVSHVDDAADLDGECIRTRRGDVQCWDSKALERFSEPIVQMRASSYWGWCGRQSSGDVLCRGYEGSVRRIAGLDAVELSCGRGRCCVVNSAGGVSCWDDDGPPTSVPVTGARKIAVGRRSACAVLADASVVCWGEDEASLGRGYIAYAWEPLVVVTRP